MNVNLNQDVQTLDACLKSINNFGSTTYQNICTGEMSVVAWGGMDWVLGGFLIVVLFLLFAMIIFLIVVLKNN